MRSWDEADGGALRIFKPRNYRIGAYDGGTLAAGETAGEYTCSTPRNDGVPAEAWPSFDILPEAGKLVVFDSCAVEHEVRPTLRSRQCVVGWFKSVRELGDTRVR